MPAIVSQESVHGITVEVSHFGLKTAGHFVVFYYVFGWVFWGGVWWGGVWQFLGASQGWTTHRDLGNLALEARFTSRCELSRPTKKP